MSPERFVYYVLGLLAIVLAFFLLVWIVNELDEEDGVDASAAPAAVEAAGRGWERGVPYEVMGA